MIFLGPECLPCAPGKGRVYTSYPSVTTSGYLFLPKCPSLDNQLQAHWDALEPGGSSYRHSPRSLPPRSRAGGRSRFREAERGLGRSYEKGLQ